MKATEANRYLGKQGTLVVERYLVINIECRDIRQVYGRVDVLVAPISGSGAAWISESRIQWEKD